MITALKSFDIMRILISIRFSYHKRNGNFLKIDLRPTELFLCNYFIHYQTLQLSDKA